MIFSFNQNKFLFNKIYLYDIKIYFYLIKNLYSKKYFCYLTCFHPIKYFFDYVNFSLNTFLVTVSGLPFLSAKVRILLSVCKLKSIMML